MAQESTPTEGTPEEPEPEKKTSIRVFVKRIINPPLEDVNLIFIEDFKHEFSTELWQQLGNEEPVKVDEYTFIPPALPPGPEPPEPTPDAKLLWDSSRDGHWDNNQKRTVTKSEGNIKPNGKGIEMRASGKPQLEIQGDGSANLVCQPGHGRFYFFATNFNSQLELEFALSKETDNLSLKLRSRHQEGGSPENRFGGYGCSIAIDEVGMKKELYHNVHSNSKSRSLSPRLRTDTWYGVRFSIRNSDDNSKVLYQCDLDYKDGKGFVSVLSHADPKPEAYAMDKASFDKQSYGWIRQNNEQKGTIRLRNMRLVDLSPSS
jgi:hypothetical protein